MVTEKQIKRLEESLLAFVERASKSDATTEEVRALPAVAHALVELHKL